MTDKAIIQMYVELLPFLSSVLGPSCEIVVHDISDIEHSLVGIANNQSGRKIGDPLTELASNFYNDFNHTDKKYILNYSGFVKNKEYLDSTFFIRNDNGNIIGFLCINKDLKCIQDVNETMKNLMNAFNLQPAENSEYTESLSNIVDHMISEQIDKAIKECGIPVGRMNRDDKIGIIHYLRDNGVLNIKGAINEVASWLDISVPTIYRYLKK